MWSAVIDRNDQMRVHSIYRVNRLTENTDYLRHIFFTHFKVNRPIFFIVVIS